MQIQANHSSAVATFTQDYQTAKYRNLGIKTVYLRRPDDRWAILKKTWQHLSG
jgi:hypothetical protein